MSTDIKLLEILWPLHTCPSNPPQRIILCAFWLIKIFISVYTKYDSYKQIENNNCALKVSFCKRIHNCVRYEKVKMIRHVISEWNSEIVRSLYSDSNCIVQFIVARRYLWSLISDCLHLGFIMVTFGEQKSMPALSLTLYCILILSDSIYSIKATKTLVSLFKSKEGVIMVSCYKGILLRFMFGPLESYLEFHYFGREIEGYTKRYSVFLGIFIAVFDLMREVMEVKIDYRLICDFRQGRDESTAIEEPCRYKTFFKNVSLDKLSEVFTVVNITTFYLDVFKIYFYLFSLTSIANELSTESGTAQNKTVTQNESTIDVVNSTGKVDCEKILSVSESLGGFIVGYTDLEIDFDIDHDKTGSAFSCSLLVLISVHYISVFFIVFLERTISPEIILTGLFRLPTNIKIAFIHIFHMCIFVIFLLLFIGMIQYSTSIIYPALLAWSNAEFWSKSELWNNLGSENGVWIFLLLLSFLICLDTLIYSFLWMCLACNNGNSTSTELAETHDLLLRLVDAQTFSDFSASIMNFMKNTNSKSDETNSHYCFDTEDKLYRKRITAMTSKIYVMIGASMFILIMIQIFHQHVLKNQFDGTGFLGMMELTDNPREDDPREDDPREDDPPYFFLLIVLCGIPTVFIIMNTLISFIIKCWKSICKSGPIDYIEVKRNFSFVGIVLFVLPIMPYNKASNRDFDHSHASSPLYELAVSTTYQPGMESEKSENEENDENGEKYELEAAGLAIFLLETASVDFDLDTASRISLPISIG